MKQITEHQCVEDEGLVDFIQTYCPQPPSEQKCCEELVMRKIFLQTEDTSVPLRTRKRKWRWILPVTVISSSLFLGSGYLFKQKLLPQLAAGYEDLETFMVNSWHGSMAEEELNTEDYFYTTISSEY